MSKRSREYKFAAASGEIFYSSARTRTRGAGAGAESPPKQKRRERRASRNLSVRREETHKSFEVYSATLYYLLNAARRPFTWVNVSAEINDSRWREKNWKFISFALVLTCRSAIVLAIAFYCSDAPSPPLCVFLII